VRRLFTALRQADDETILVIVNTHDEPVTETTLWLEVGSLTGVTTAEVLYTNGLNSVTLTNIPAPTINAAGGFDAYLPLTMIPPFATIVLRLS